MNRGSAVRMDFSLTYEPKDEYNETGYHTTYTIYKDSIINNGFKPSVEDGDWLGEGVYFWDNEENALWWKRKSSLMEKCIFVCDLNCPVENYLNLDDKSRMKEFEKFSGKYLSSMISLSKMKPSFSNNDQRRKFFCDIYCTKNDIDILSFTFEHDITNKFGFKTGTYKRRQICVREPKCISIKDIKE